MAKQLALKEGVGHGGAIDLHQRPLLAAAVFMDRPCHQFFAGPRLTVDQHRGVGVGHLVDQAQHLLNDLGPANDIGLGAPGLGQHPPQPAVLLFYYPEMHHLTEQFSHSAEDFELAVEILHLVRQFIGRQHSHGPVLIKDGNTEKGKLITIEGFSGAGPVEKEGLISQVGKGQRTARLRHLAGDPLSRLIGNLARFESHPAGNIQRDLTGLQIEDGNHSPFHPQPGAQNIEGLLQLILQVVRARQHPCNLMEGPQLQVTKMCTRRSQPLHHSCI